MGHTDVVPVDESGWDRDPFGAEIIANPDGVDEVWGRGAVDMLNMTASLAVAVRDLFDRGFRPRGDLVFFAVADEEAGSTYGARWVADEHRDAIAVDNVLTENGGLHDGDDDAPVISVTVAEKGVAWRRLRVAGTPGHGSMPFRVSNALVKAAAVVGRLADYRPAPRFHELWRDRVRHMRVSEEAKAALLDPSAVDDLLAAIPSSAAAAHLHACTHTTFSPNLVDGGVMKTNVIPGSVDLDVDIRTMPGETADDVDAHLRAALGELYDDVEITVLINDMASISRSDTPLWDAMQQAVSVPFPAARLNPTFAVGFTDARVFRELGSVAYGAGLFSRTLDSAEYGRRFHGHNERIDVDSVTLTTDFYRRVVTEFLG
jgi:acetylornithine deacetylase/succinyl-diaminopimelate desuccinylase-like protein